MICVRGSGSSIGAMGPFLALSERCCAVGADLQSGTASRAAEFESQVAGGAKDIPYQSWQRLAKPADRAARCICSLGLGCPTLSNCGCDALGNPQICKRIIFLHSI